MSIRRIDSYSDERFSREVLQQHGAFLIDEKTPCAFRITGEDSATVELSDPSALSEAIAYFRFFAEHITRFYDSAGRLLASFAPVEQMPLALERIQPSQFYVDSEKLAAIATFIHSAREIVVPVCLDKRRNRYISLDGHTRLFYAWQQGWDTVRVYETETFPSVFAFVDEARRRGIHRVKDMRKLGHEEYEVQWNQFCDAFLGEYEHGLDTR